MKGILLGEQSSPCGYLPWRTATQEAFFVLEDISEEDLSFLISQGYRHFGTFFYRPVCTDCHACIPIRLPVEKHRFTPSQRRLMHTNSRYTVQILRPQPSEEKYAIYCEHKKRFEDENAEPYEEFVQSFFHQFPSSYEMDIFDGERLFCVSHIDITLSCISAVYCYYRAAYSPASPGKYAIVMELEEAHKRSIPYLYLGFLVAGNRHMKYKAGYYPNELLVTEGDWRMYRDEKNRIIDESLIKRGFLPQTRLQAGEKNPPRRP
ncbi:MAG TPA: hypothetical protein PLG43_02745 [Spirochaetia bacterium]|nr:hypothetical protein [Spirochaetia bacterium]